VRRKDRPTPPPADPLVAGTAARLEAIVEAAERAAVGVIDDAETQARKRLAEAEAEAERLVADRLAALSELTDSLLAEAEAVRGQSERLVAALEQAKRSLDSDGPQSEPALESSRPNHLTAVEPMAPPAPASPTGLRAAPAAEPGSAAGARLLATQMAVSGSSREEIEAKLRNGFEIEDTASILDAILGPEE
jgi:vacuolar-type H+-ATPase subunit H